MSQVMIPTIEEIRQVIREELDAAMAQRDESGSDRLYSTQDIAKRYSIAEPTARQLIAKGAFGETVNVGRLHRVTAEGIQRFEKTHTGHAHTAKPNSVRRKRPSTDEPKKI